MVQRRRVLCWLSALGSLGCVLVRQHQLLCGQLGTATTRGNLRRIPCAVPVRIAEGMQQLMQPGDAVHPLLIEDSVSCDEEGLGGFEAMLAQEQDVEPLSKLLIEGFWDVIDRDLLEERQWGPLATIWNRLNVWLDEQAVLYGLGQNLKRGLTPPYSILRPRGRPLDGHSLGLLLVPRVPAERRVVPPVAFCELCLLPPDGRRPEDLEEVWSSSMAESLQACQPYFHNFCVAPHLQRRGLGRGLLHLAEDVVRRVWGDNRMYLHAEENSVAAQFYTSAGYVPTANSSFLKAGEPFIPQRTKDGKEIVHMAKVLQ